MNAGRYARGLPASAARRAALRAVCFFRRPESNVPGKVEHCGSCEASTLDSGRRKKQSGSRQVPSASAHRPCPMLSAFIRVRQRPEKNTSPYLRNRVLSVPVHNYGNVCGQGPRGELKARGGGDVKAHRRRRATRRSPAAPVRPKGGGGAAPSALSLLLDDAQGIVSVVASRIVARRAGHIRCRNCEQGY